MKQYAIGIDLGGTIIKLGLLKDHELLEERRIDSQKGLKPNLEIMEAEINCLLRQNELEASDLKGIGVAFPGLVDSRAKKVLSTNQKYDDACHLDLENWVQEKWDTSFFIDNDARMAAVGEWKFGAGKGCDNLVAVTLGTGIGTSAVIEGKLLRGKHFQAGILGGHLSLNYHGNKCTCGNIGCAEAEASTWNISDKIKKDPLFPESRLFREPKLDFEALFRGAKENDTLALQVTNDCLRIWATAVINLIHAYDPEVVVLSGGILNSREMILPYIQKTVDTYAWCPWGSVTIKASTLQHKAAILGITYSLDHQL